MGLESKIGQKLRPVGPWTEYGRTYGRTYVRTDGRKISPFYRTLSPIGAAAQKPTSKHNPRSVCPSLEPARQALDPASQVSEPARQASEA